MRILIEGVPYPYDQVKDLVPLSDTWGKVEKDVYMPYVGYYYNSTLGDCVFILPKVVLDENNKVSASMNRRTSYTSKKVKLSRIQTSPWRKPRND